MNPSVYLKRRKELASKMGEGVAIIFNAPECIRTGDMFYPYRPDSNFWYLTGYNENKADSSVLVIVAGEKPESIFFCAKEVDAMTKAFEGDVVGPKRAKMLYGFTKAYPISEIDKRMPKILASHESVHYVTAWRDEWDARVFGWIKSARDAAYRAAKMPAMRICDISRTLAEMRLLKDEHELDRLSTASYITSEAAYHAMEFCRPVMSEYELEAEILKYFRSRACGTVPAFPCIVASGVNATTLHYHENNSIMRNGDLVLVDIGAECDWYAGDISRTFPVNGKFSPAQRRVYEIVLTAQKAAIAQIKIGNRFNDAHFVAAKTITEGLVDIGLLQGDPTELFERGKDPKAKFGTSYKRFFMHRTSHWLGLDAHDVGCYVEPDGSSRILVSGMVLTAEPGIYIPDEKDIPAEYRGIGIRIEDDVLVTKEGPKLLSENAPKEISHIENIMKR